MSANVETMFYAGEEPWHGLGTAVEREVTAAAAIKLAGLDWRVEKEPMYLGGEAEVDGIPVIGKAIPEKMAMVRQSDRSVLGVVNSTYKPIQNSECFEFMDAVVGGGQAIYHTAGSLANGRLVWILMQLPQDMRVGDDVVKKYLLLSTAHDSSRALSVRFTPVRVVCQNTLNAAEGRRPADYIIRHTTSAATKIAEARRALGLSEAYYARMEVEFNRMLKAEMTKLDMEAFTEKLIPGEDEDKPFEVSSQKIKTRACINRLFTGGIGHESLGQTRWAAYNAVTEYVDHHIDAPYSKRLSPKEARFYSLIFGTGSEIKQKAFALLTM